jgi:hypothetical protein
MKSATIFTTMLLALSMSVSAQSKDKKKEKEKLDAEVFVTEVNAVATDNKAPAKGKPDEVSFKNGRMKSNYFEEKGAFKPANYTVTKDSVDADEDRYIEFETLMKNENEEELEIKGTVIGNDIEGTAKWSKNGKLKKEYTIAGSVKKGKK